MVGVPGVRADAHRVSVSRHSAGVGDVLLRDVTGTSGTGCRLLTGTLYNRYAGAVVHRGESVRRLAPPNWHRFATTG